MSAKMLQIEFHKTRHKNIQLDSEDSRRKDITVYYQVLRKGTA